MKKPPVPPALAEPGHCEKVFREGEATLLTVRARWPRLEETSPGIRRLNRYYAALADRWLKRWEGPLQARAKAVLAEGGAGMETLPWSASLDFTVTLFQDGVLSLYLDTVEAVGARRPRRVGLLCGRGPPISPTPPGSASRRATASPPLPPPSPPWGRTRRSARTA